jgi:hypothetical protein
LGGGATEFSDSLAGICGCVVAWAGGDGRSDDQQLILGFWSGLKMLALC